MNPNYVENKKQRMTFQKEMTLTIILKHKNQVLRSLHHKILAFVPVNSEEIGSVQTEVSIHLSGY